MVVDVSTTLCIYAAHIDVKMVYQMSRCIPLLRIQPWQYLGLVSVTRTFPILIK
jgi:hypothetical protein